MNIVFRLFAFGIMFFNYSAIAVENDWYSEKIKNSRDHFVCNGIGFIDFGSATDGPSFYFRNSDKKKISVCGGACMLPRGDQVEVCKKLCPPPEWESNECALKYRKYLSDRLPVLTEQEIVSKGMSMLDCKDVKICQVKAEHKGEFWFISSSKPTLNTNAEVHRRKYGLASIKMSIKGEFIEATGFDGSVVEFNHL